MTQDSVASGQSNRTERPVSSTKGSQVSDVIVSDFSSEPHHSSIEDTETGNNMNIGNKGKLY